MNRIFLRIFKFFYSFLGGVSSAGTRQLGAGGEFLSQKMGTQYFNHEFWEKRWPTGGQFWESSSLGK